uniref:Ig-like domain-containing protein n=1 Tax=Echeneis naucrates TaxID=173247 RepID=A0A665U3X0_ECHNA
WFFSLIQLLQAPQMWWSGSGLELKSEQRQLGDHQQLVCSVQDCPVEPSFSWSLLGDRPQTGTIYTNKTLSVLTFNPVMMEHEGALLCKVTCGGERRAIKTSVQVYCEYRHTQTHTQQKNLGL